ncbi:MAG: chemotaxis protein CheA [Chitinivibrionales bacterium]|nr:chemotaxis protein CheA [Chitinivibrionales bacterium]
MNVNSYEQAQALLNAACAKLPMVNATDLSILADIMQTFEMLSEVENIPVAFQRQAKRTASLCKLFIMNEGDFDTIIGKITLSCEKMIRSLKRLSESTFNSEEVKAFQEPEAQEMAVPSETPCTEPLMFDDMIDDQSASSLDMKDLIAKFASQQLAILEDFEALCLDYEENVVGARDSIKRMLHTWKGEFGVINMNQFSKLIHAIEEAFESPAFPAESLFRLKDLLLTKLAILQTGSITALSQQEISYVFDPIRAGQNAGTGSYDPVHSQVKQTFSNQQPEENQQQPFTDAASFENHYIHVDQSLINDFIHESKDHIDTIEPLLLDLENDPQNQDKINTIFRSCHTIKGVASFLGLTEISNLSHGIENIMDLARKRELVLTPIHIDLLFQGMDCLKSLIAAVEQGSSEKKFKVPESYSTVYQKISNPALFNKIGENLVEPLSQKLGAILIDKGVVNQRNIEDALEKQASGDERKIGEILLQDQEVPARSIGKALASQIAANQQQKAISETIRVPVERLDQLIDSIGEAVIAQSMIYEELNKNVLKDRSLDKKISQASLIMRQVQELSMSLRMVSIKATFQKMARLVRDLSKKTSKAVEFSTEGEETELDKTVVEKISDPLIHMVRNSVDHGIESPQERLAAGKPEHGTICLKAYHKAGSVVIEIGDDGRGLNVEKIRSKAIEKGILEKTDIRSNTELFQLIFIPGFSTAEVVTDVSGRGVGMDVVRRNIESLRGSIEIHSEIGKGTVFTIKLPLTLAIIDGMIVRSTVDSYIIPTLSIIESIRPKPDQIFTVAGKGHVIKVRGNLHTLVNLSALLANRQDMQLPENGIVMIVEDMMGKRIGIVVDSILGQQQVVIKTLGSHMGDIPGVAGGAIMSDGTVNLILDIGGIVKMATKS